MENIKIGVIGLGYVGLPLACLFASKYNVVGYDINNKRVEEINSGIDTTLEVQSSHLKNVLRSTLKTNGLKCSSILNDIADCNVYIVTVPTPIDVHKKPVLQPLYDSSAAIGAVLKKNDIVIYESTVYPGVTEEECVPILEKHSGLIFNKDFFAGYSPERINPGDKLHTVDKILKVTSGSTPEIGKKVDDLYASVITAGTHLAPSIKVAEAAKVIENSQRDINIAFVNELAKIFNLMDIDTQDVLEAAGTKWNFLPFKPGLVGGHCIGVDPYYLAEKALNLGYNPEIILAGRRLNDSMGSYVASQVIKLLLKNDIPVKGSEILVLGITFKENCPDVRNSRVVDIHKNLIEYGVNLTTFDPWVNNEEVFKEFGIDVTTELPNHKFDAIIQAVSHDEFQKIDFSLLRKDGSIIYDVKGTLKGNVDGRL
ncbi:nucleotide sugar dehydrogenase [Dokdonia sp. LLG6352-1]|uniref:nucleotide sugar dehydrogenase n=1 Tax=Dokdonia sp. LLG6352-1 TaxID=3160831 RepID=UPI00386D95F2